VRNYALQIAGQLGVTNGRARRNNAADNILAHASTPNRNQEICAANLIKPPNVS
jgi:hypothetical protein